MRVRCGGALAGGGTRRGCSESNEDKWGGTAGGAADLLHKKLQVPMWVNWSLDDLEQAEEYQRRLYTMQRLLTPGPP